MNADTETIITHVISDYHAADDTRTVEVIVSGFARDVKISAELIEAAPKLYEVLGEAREFLRRLDRASIVHTAPTPIGKLTIDIDIEEADFLLLLRHIDRASAEAKGVIADRPTHRARRQSLAD
jgi:hypothetical protein